MKIADILRTLAANLEHAQGGAPDPRIQNPAQMIDVAVVADADSAESPNGTTPSGNDKAPEVFMPPLQQKQELLKKAVGVENVYDDGGPVEQHEAEEAQTESDDMSAERDDIVDRIKRLSGIPKAAIQELSNDEVFDD
jgi:hypothetical protein